MARKIVLTSGKGGVGKSTICLSLGKQLAFGGAKVVMLDVDVGLNNLDIVAGIQPNVLYDVVSSLFFDFFTRTIRPIKHFNCFR